MKTTPKTLLAAVAGTVLALTGSGLLAAGAVADTGTAVDTAATITLNAASTAQLDGLKLKYYKIASYMQYGSGATAKYSLKAAGFTGNSLTETDPARKIRATILTLGTAGAGLPLTADPLDWAQTQSPPLFTAAAGDTGTATDNSRTLATALASLAASDGTAVTPTVSADTPTQASITVPAGLYVLVDDGSPNPTVPIIVGTAPFTGATGTVNLKNTAIPVLTKTSDCAGSAHVGQTCTFRLTTKMPDLTNRDTYTLTFTDKPGKGLTVDPTGIKIGGATGALTAVTALVASVSPLTALVGDGTSALTISLTKLQLAALGLTAGADLVVTYPATVNKAVLDSADTGGLTHTVGNSATVSANGAVSAAASAAITVSDFGFTKVWGDGSAAGGATFTVMKDGKYLQAQDATTKTWGWGTTAHDFTADADGVYTFQGLADGTYTITESRQADGAMYILPQFTVVISHGNAVPAAASASVTAGDPYGLVTVKAQTPKTDSAAASSMIAQITNVRSVTQLPMTGGSGIAVAVLVMVALFAGAIVLVMVYRRKAGVGR